MTAKLVVLLTKSEVTHGLIDALGMFKFVCFFDSNLISIPNSNSNFPAISQNVPKVSKSKQTNSVQDI